MKLSIITINYNNQEGLVRTIKSVASQTSRDFEYIVVDGNSSDGSMDVIEKYDYAIDKYISEPDTGIYNAMNKGVRMSSGDYCLFINSGDELFRDTTVEEILNCELKSEFIEGKVYIEALDSYSKPQVDINASFYLFGCNNFHQASLISRELILSNPYDESLKIASDLKFNFECIILKNCTYSTMDVVIAKYEYGGRSLTVKHDEEIKRIFETTIPPRILKDYLSTEMMYVFPSKILRPIMTWLFHKRMIRSMGLNIKSRILKRKVSQVPLLSDIFQGICS